MQDIFISPIATPISSWLAAFPDAIFVQTAEQVSFAEHQEAIFWLHKNQDTFSDLQLEEFPQLWLTQAVNTIRAGAPTAKIVLLSNLPNQPEAMHCLRVGVLGYSHAYTEAKVLQEIRAVIAHGGIWLGQETLRQLIETSTKRLGSQAEYVDSLLNKLTAREREVALQTAKGDSNKQIARTLQITERTVKAHLAHIFERLGARDRLQLALMLNKSTGK